MSGIGGRRRRATAHRIVIGGTLAALLAACGSGTVGGPTGVALVRDSDGRARGPFGLEQRLVTKVEQASPESPYTATLVATSTLLNTGSAPVRVTARMCLFKEDDVFTTAKLDRFEPLVACGGDAMTIDLAPGASIGPMEARFGVRSAAGQYTLGLRHSLSPAFRAEATFTIP